MEASCSELIALADEAMNALLDDIDCDCDESLWDNVDAMDCVSIDSAAAELCAMISRHELASSSSSDGGKSATVTTMSDYGADYESDAKWHAHSATASERTTTTTTTTVRRLQDCSNQFFDGRWERPLEGGAFSELSLAVAEALDAAGDCDPIPPKAVCGDSDDTASVRKTMRQRRGLAKGASREDMLQTINEIEKTMFSDRAAHVSVIGCDVEGLDEKPRHRRPNDDGDDDEANVVGGFFSRLRAMVKSPRFHAELAKIGLGIFFLYWLWNAFATRCDAVPGPQSPLDRALAREASECAARGCVLERDLALARSEWPVARWMRGLLRSAWHGSLDAEDCADRCIAVLHANATRSGIANAARARRHEIAAEQLLSGGVIDKALMAAYGSSVAEVLIGPATALANAVLSSDRSSSSSSDTSYAADVAAALQRCALAFALISLSCRLLEIANRGLGSTACAAVRALGRGAAAFTAAISAASPAAATLITQGSSSLVTAIGLASGGAGRALRFTAWASGLGFSAASIAYTLPVVDAMAKSIIVSGAQFGTSIAPAIGFDPADAVMWIAARGFNDTLAAAGVLGGAAAWLASKPPRLARKLVHAAESAFAGSSFAPWYAATAQNGSITAAMLANASAVASRGATAAAATAPRDPLGINWATVLTVTSSVTAALARDGGGDGSAVASTAAAATASVTVAGIISRAVETILLGAAAGADAAGRAALKILTHHQHDGMGGDDANTTSVSASTFATTLAAAGAATFSFYSADAVRSGAALVAAAGSVVDDCVRTILWPSIDGMRDIVIDIMDETGLGARAAWGFTLTVFERVCAVALSVGPDISAIARTAFRTSAPGAVAAALALIGVASENGVGFAACDLFDAVFRSFAEPWFIVLAAQVIEGAPNVERSDGDDSGDRNTARFVFATALMFMSAGIKYAENKRRRQSRASM